MIHPAYMIGSFLAGFASFFAPCCLPLLPSYLTAITGFTFKDLYGLTFPAMRWRIFLASLFFSFGFWLVFILLGATGSLAGQLLEQYLPILVRGSGLLLVVMGLIQLGILSLPSLEFDYAWNVQKRLTKLGYTTAVVTGVAAAVSWIPCVGPLLSPILLLAAVETTVWQGIFLLSIYTAGLMVPFLAMSLCFPWFLRSYQQHTKLFVAVSKIAGLVMIGFGSILLADQYQLFIALFSQQSEWLREKIF